MKLLVLGGTSATHALVWHFFNESEGQTIVCAPGNGGVGLLVPCADPPDTPQDTCMWSFQEGLHHLLPTTDELLLDGIVDEALSFSMRAFGPPQATALMLASHLRSKEFMLRHSIPSPSGAIFADPKLAERALGGTKLPVALRGDRSSERDGVYHERYAAMEALRQLFTVRPTVDVLRGVIIEEHIPGPEVALSALTDGETLLPLLPVRLYGPASPEQAAVAEHSPLARRLCNVIVERCLRPLLGALQAEGRSYQGQIGVTCVLGPQGPLVTDLRCSWAPQEAEALLPLLDSDLGATLRALWEGRLSTLPPLRWRDEACVALSITGEEHGGLGYPVSGLDLLDDGVLVFHNNVSSASGLRYHQQQGTPRKTQPLADLSAPLTTNGGAICTISVPHTSVAVARDVALYSATRLTLPRCRFLTTLAPTLLG